MKTRLLALFTALLCATAALADVARPVLQSSTTKALVDDLATGAKKMTISATGTLEWVNGATLTGASYFRTAAGLGIGVNVQAYDADLTTWAGISPSANVQTLLGASNYAAFKTSLSLNNVENTALSTWQGTTNINTVGELFGTLTLSEGAGFAHLSVGGAKWDNVGSSGFDVTLSAGTPAANVTYTLGGASGTIITTGNLSSITATGTISSGTWHGSVIGEAYGGTGLSALGIGVSTALGNAVNASGGVLTYGMIGSSGTKIPLLDAANSFSAVQTLSSLVLGSTSGGTTSQVINVSLAHYTAGTPRPLEVNYWTGSYALRLDLDGSLSVGGNITAALNLAAGNSFYFPNSNLLMYATTASDTGNAYTFTDNGGTNLRQIKARSIQVGATVSGDLVNIEVGTGSPEGVLTAKPGSIYLNQSGGAGTTLYIKESGTGNTGWIGK